MNHKYTVTGGKKRKAQLSTSKINKSEDAKFLRYLAFLLETDSKILFFSKICDSGLHKRSFLLAYR